MKNYGDCTSDPERLKWLLNQHKTVLGQTEQFFKNNEDLDLSSKSKVDKFEEDNFHCAEVLMNLGREIYTLAVKLRLPTQPKILLHLAPKIATGAIWERDWLQRASEIRKEIFQLQVEVDTLEDQHHKENREKRPDDLMNTRKAVEKYRISRMTLSRYATKGIIKKYRFKQGKTADNFWSEKELDRALPE